MRKTGKYQIVPIIADDRNDPTEGTNAALKLITQDKVLAVVGPLTSKVAIPVSEIADKVQGAHDHGHGHEPKVTVYDGKRKPTSSGPASSTPSRATWRPTLP